jgi:hypothetical protein
VSLGQDPIAARQKCNQSITSAPTATLAEAINISSIRRSSVIELNSWKENRRDGGRVKSTKALTSLNLART